MYIVKGQSLMPFTHTFQDLRQVLDYAVETYGDHPAYRFRRQAEGEIYTKSYREVKADIQAFGTGLLELGFKAGSARLVTIGANSYDWVVASNAALFGMGLSIPIDRQLPAGEVLELTRRGRADTFVYHHGHRDIALEVAAKNPHIRYFIAMDERGLQGIDDPRFYLMPDILKKGQERLEAGDRRFAELPLDREQMAALIFTSGTTAVSKGVMLSHKNLAANVTSIMKTLEIRAAGERALSVLPLHHTFENTVGVYGFWAYGVTTSFMDGLRYLIQNLNEYRITMIISVPLLIENIYRQIRKNAEKKGKLKTIERLIPLLSFLKKGGLDLRRKLFSEIHQALGGELWLSVVGAAALDPKVQTFLNGIGLTCWAGYGLTETSPVVAACNQRISVDGSVGWPIADVEVAIDDEQGRDPDHTGEILVRGDNVMLGYYENPEATAEVLDDQGWLHTGDVGYIDQKNCLYITGRIKSMIVFPNGKKAFPEEIETLLGRIEGVVDSMVWGETNARENVDVSAQIRLDPDSLPAGLDDDQKIADWLTGAVHDINEQMPVYRRIKYFVFTEDEFSKTTTLKIRRNEQARRNARFLSEKGVTMAEANGRRVRDGLLL